MAHFATLNNDNVVIAVEVVNNDGKEQEQLGIDFLEQIHGGGGVTYKQTSYNESIRKNFAQIGGTYDPSRDAFIYSKTYPSWVLNESTCKWEAPVSQPDDGKPYVWDESSTSWKEVPDPGS